jgi:hypothetical protein
MKNEINIKKYKNVSNLKKTYLNFFRSYNHFFDLTVIPKSASQEKGGDGAHNLNS